MKKNSRRNANILKEWNAGERSMTEIGEAFGLSDGAVAGVLHRARNRGDFVLSVSTKDAARRAHKSSRKRMGVDHYAAWMRERSAQMLAVRWAP